ncbi:MAG: AIR carboxylase family protein [Akkermansia sp.]
MKVIVIYGSPNDKPFMEPAREYFAQEGVPYEETVLSAHRDLPELIKFLGDLEASGEKAVILAVAGLSAALPGVVVMSCSLPVIGVPVPGGPLNGIDALLAIAQCPGGVPCTTVGLHKKTPVNAAHGRPPYPEAGGPVSIHFFPFRLMTPPPSQEIVLDEQEFPARWSGWPTASWPAAPGNRSPLSASSARGHHRPAAGGQGQGTGRGRPVRRH